MQTSVDWNHKFSLIFRRVFRGWVLVNGWETVWGMLWSNYHTWGKQRANLEVSLKFTEKHMLRKWSRTDIRYIIFVRTGRRNDLCSLWELCRFAFLYARNMTWGGSRKQPLDLVHLLSKLVLIVQFYFQNLYNISHLWAVSIASDHMLKINKETSSPLPTWGWKKIYN